jgi:DNA primase
VPDYNEWPERYMIDCWEEFVAADGFDIRRHNGPNGWVLFPRGDKDSPTGWEARSRLKEITRNILPEYKEDTKLLIYNKDASRTAVVCEDPISAMKVSLAGYAGVSLCGTNMTSDDAFKMSLLFDNILLWLDNDKPEIVAQAHRLMSKIAMYTSNVKINKLDMDTKKYSTKYIVETVKGAFGE